MARTLEWVGLGCAVGAFAMVLGYKLVAVHLPWEREQDTVAVIVASRDLQPGVAVTEEDLYAVQMAPRYLPDGVFVAPEHVVGRIPHERILGNEIVRAERLFDPRTSGGLGAILPRGMRAISLQIDDAGLSDFLKPDDYVDLLVTRTDAEGRVETHTLFQALYVVGVHHGEQPAVTLLVTAQLAESIAFTESVGEVSLTLRNNLDPAGGCLGSNAYGVLLVDTYDLRSQLLGAQPPVRPKSPLGPRRCRAFTILSGGQKTVLLVDELGIPCE